MTRFQIFFALTAPAALLLACSSSSNGTGTTGTSTGGSKTTSSSSTAGTAGSTTASGSSSSSGTTTTTGTGGAANCEEACTTAQPAAYAKFQGYLLADCACASGAPCATDCSAACPSGTPSSACTACLMTQENMQQNSACVTTAGTTCINDTSCSPFIACELPCME